RRFGRQVAEADGRGIGHLPASRHEGNAAGDLAVVHQLLEGRGDGRELLRREPDLLGLGHLQVFAPSGTKTDQNNKRNKKGYPAHGGSSGVRGYRWTKHVLDSVARPLSKQNLEGCGTSRCFTAKQSPVPRLRPPSDRAPTTCDTAFPSR